MDDNLEQSSKKQKNNVNKTIEVNWQSFILDLIVKGCYNSGGWEYKQISTIVGSVTFAFS